MSSSPDAATGLGTPRSKRWVALTLVGTWTFLGLLLAFADQPLEDALWIVSSLIWVAYWLVGAVILAVLLSILGWGADARGRVSSVVAVLGCGFLVMAAYSPLARIGDEYWFQRRFDRLEPTYRSLAERLSVGAHLSASDTAGTRVVLDAGPPLRVAFPQPGGIIDNWEGIVYDPTGAVRSATGWRDGVAGRYSAPPEIRALFGGDLVTCRHVRASFYRCWFT